MVLGLLVLYLAIAVAPGGNAFWTITLTIFVGALIPLAVAGTDFKMQTVYLSVIGAVVACALFSFGKLLESAALQSSGRLLLSFLFLFAQVLILADVIRQPDVTVDTILGGVGAYLFFGLIWAFIYVVLLRYQPEALVGPTGDAGEHTASMLYFSVVTQTTLGYGDIQPVTGLARGLVQIEALLGQLYIAVFVAWIVGRLLSSTDARRAAAKREDAD